VPLAHSEGSALLRILGCRAEEWAIRPVVINDAVSPVCLHNRYCGLVIACTVPTKGFAPVCRNRITAPVTVDDTAPQVSAVLHAATAPSPLFHVAITCRDAESGIESLTLCLHTEDGQVGVLPLITAMTNASEARNMTSVIGRVNTTDINGKVAITQARTHTRALIPRPCLSLTSSHRQCWFRSLRQPHGIEH
jgi:hypothetical protein